MMGKNGKKVAVIGGGAAGCFAAVNMKEMNPDLDVTVYESGPVLLAKVAVTGGGRCNLTNSFAEVRSIESVYPRGFRLMKRLLREFSNTDVCDWFEGRGVRLVTQSDQCVFPKSQQSSEIIETLVAGMKSAGVNVAVSHRLTSVLDTGGDQQERYKLLFDTGRGTEKHQTEIYADIVLITTGGSPKKSGLSMLDGLGLEIIDPVPSLFSFNIGAPEALAEIRRGNGSKSSLAEAGKGSGVQVVLTGTRKRDGELSALMGIVTENVVTGLAGTKFRAEGPLLITDWGMSGPAVLKLSSYAAKYLAEQNYSAELMVNWAGKITVPELESVLSRISSSASRKMSANVGPDFLNNRLWTYLLHRAGIPADRRWAEIGSKGLNRIISTLTSDIYPVVGRNKFKGEFVTCGGVSLADIDPKTLESRQHPGLYFAGEVTDVDAVTGGFNLQAAWTMGWVAARAIAQS